MLITVLILYSLSKSGKLLLRALDSKALGTNARNPAYDATIWRHVLSTINRGGLGQKMCLWAKCTPCMGERL